MEPLGTWLTDSDRAILSYMTNYPDLELPPRAWHHNLPTTLSVATVQNRLRELSQIDEPMVERTRERGGYYRITDFGQRVAAGDVSAERIQELKPHNGNAGGH